MNRHKQSKKHKYYYSNLIINKYVVRNYENEKFKNIFQSYYDEHKKKIRYFTVWVICTNNDEIVCEIKLPSNLLVEKRYRLGIEDIEPLFRIESCVEFLDSLKVEEYDCDEINKIFIPELKYITFIHFMEQPKSMLCRKLVKLLSMETMMALL